MNIIVCVKQVPDTTVVKIDPVKGTLIREGVPSIMNPDDKGGLELALRLKDQFGANVTVISMGPPQADVMLREALAMGADRAILLSDRKFAGADPLATSYALSGLCRVLEAKDFDKTLDFTKIKPYGDTMNDGKVQLSFTLPVPCGAEAVEAAKQLLRKMGLENPSVVFYKELTPGFTFFNCYGSCTHTVDYSTIYVPKVESNTMDMYETDEYIKENIGRKIVIVGASTGT